MTLRTLVLLALGICLWATAPSSATPIAEGSGKKGTQYAILVAIAKYGKTDQWRPLPYTIEEMREFRDVLLETGFAKENVEFLHDQQTDDKLRPTAANFVEKIKIILEEIGPDDTLLIALNGHGVQYKDDPVGYFCPVNADLLDKKTMVPMDGKEGVYRLLEACKAKRKLLIVNACRNDPTRDLSFASEKVQLIDRDETEVPKGIAALFSCKPGQKSYYYPEEKQIKRSMFYHHLIEAWRGKYAAGEKVTLDHIFDAVTRKTAADARTIFSQSQTPWPRRKYEGEWLLTKYVPVRPVPKDDSPFPAAAEMRFKAFDRPGVPMFEEITTVTKQTVKTTDQQLNQDQKYVSLIEWTPKEKDSDGNWVVLQRYVGVKLEIDTGGKKIVYDSTQQNLAKNPMTEFFDALLKGELTFVIQRDLTVKSVEGRDELIRKLGVVEPETASLLNSILSEDACKAMTETIIAVLPPAGVIPKKPWTRESRKNLGPIGICKTVQTFTHQGTSDSKDKIGIETKMTYQSPAAGNKADLSFVIREGNLTGEATGGLAIFDRALGRFESVRMSMKLSGQLKIEIGGTVSDVSLTQTQETSSVTSSKNPWLRP